MILLGAFLGFVLLLVFGLRRGRLHGQHLIEDGRRVGGMLEDGAFRFLGRGGSGGCRCWRFGRRLRFMSGCGGCLGRRFSCGGWRNDGRYGSNGGSHGRFYGHLFGFEHRLGGQDRLRFGDGGGCLSDGCCRRLAFLRTTRAAFGGFAFRCLGLLLRLGLGRGFRRLGLGWSGGFRRLCRFVFLRTARATFGGFAFRFFCRVGFGLLFGSGGLSGRFGRLVFGWTAGAAAFLFGFLSFFFLLHTGYRFGLSVKNLINQGLFFDTFNVRESQIGCDGLQPGEIHVCEFDNVVFDHVVMWINGELAGVRGAEADMYTQRPRATRLFAYDVTINCIYREDCFFVRPSFPGLMGAI